MLGVGIIWNECRGVRMFNSPDCKSPAAALSVNTKAGRQPAVGDFWSASTRRCGAIIRPDGTSRVLWSQQGDSVAAIPSPDGTHLAIAGWTRQSNVWMLTDF